MAGLAGVGKTTLAVAAGHAAVRQGWFGGGVLFIDLHRYDEALVESLSGAGCAAAGAGGHGAQRRANWAAVRGYDYPRRSRRPGAPEAAKCR